MTIAILVPVCLWVASVVMTVAVRLPELVRPDMHVEMVEPTFDGLRMLLRGTEGRVVRGEDATRILMVGVVMLVAGLWWARRAAVGAVFAMSLGLALLLRAPFFGPGGAMWVGGVVVGMGMVLVVTSASRLLQAEGLAGRMAEASAVLLLPVAALVFLQVGTGGAWRIVAQWLMPVFGGLAVCTLVVSLVRLRPVTRPTRWWAAVLVLAVWWGGVAQAREWVRAARAGKLERQLKAIPEVARPNEYARDAFHRGVSFIRDGFEAYYPEPTAKMMDELKGYSVDSIAVVPYGDHVMGSGKITLGREGQDGPLYLGLMKLAHGRGMRVFLKPQLMVMPGMFPGAIVVKNIEERRAWFQSYREWIVFWAKIAEEGHADLFAVGTELEKLSAFGDEWREVVAAVRAVYRGPITYAATQGPDFEQTPWWDAVDVIGLNDYYPLRPDLDMSGVIEKVEAVQRKFGKPVLLTEVGFASVAGAEEAPWAEPRRPVDLEHQATCYRALIRAFAGKPWFRGMYWWKVGADGRGGAQDRSLTPWRKPAMEVVGEYYRGLANQ